MNRPCKINFHADSAPLLEDLPDRYQRNAVGGHAGVSIATSVLVQHAFYVDYAPSILRTRVGGPNEDPVDFFTASVSHIEWFYGPDVPAPLTPYVPREPRDN